MMPRFQFNRKQHGAIEVEGMRVDLAGDVIRVIDPQGRPLMSFDHADLSSWWKVPEPSLPSA